MATLNDSKSQPVIDTRRRDTAAPGLGIQGTLTDTTHFTRVLPDRVYGWIPGPGARLAD